MSKYKHHDPIIDDWDLKRIVDKSTVIKRIIAWLNRLLELDPTIDKKEVLEAIGMLQSKKNILDAKYESARQDMLEEADLLVCAFGDDD